MLIVKESKNLSDDSKSNISSEYTKTVDKKKFILEMINLPREDNFKIANDLQESVVVLQELVDIARKIGYAKDNLVNTIDEIASDARIDEWDKNNREYNSVTIRKEN